MTDKSLNELVDILKNRLTDNSISLDSLAPEEVIRVIKEETNRMVKEGIIND